MVEKIAVRIGKKPPKYFPAQGDKKQMLSVDVAENTRVKEAGQWGDGPTHWYDARFTGADADLINEQFQQGDALILLGTKEHRVKETPEGKSYRTTRFYVESFGINPRLTTFTIDRSQRQNQAQDAQQAASQSVSQGTAWQPPAPPAEPSDVVPGGVNQHVDPSSQVPPAVPENPWAAVQQIRDEYPLPPQQSGAPGFAPQ